MSDDRGGVPVPREARESALPYPLTFFLSAGERRRVLKKLDAFDEPRERALLLALGVVEEPTDRRGGGGSRGSSDREGGA
ncbi:MAG: hypothetical protein ACF8SC_06695 [Phycisphaerales bacterium JB037]